MVGRRRRGTTSSADSIDNDQPQIRYRPELSVLHALTPDELKNENSWVTFELHDAVILSKDGSQLENALDIALRGPYIIRGRMIVEDAEQKARLISRVRSPVPIEILQSQRYSIGETEGGRPDGGKTTDDNPLMPVLWVSGQGGWFEIHPAPEYLHIYREMCDAIRLWYTIYDIYKADPELIKAKSRSTDPLERIAPLFLKYAVRVGSGITIQEVSQRCHDIAPFLIGQMMQDDLAFWKKTYFYEWLKIENEDVFKELVHLRRHPKPLPPIGEVQVVPTATTLPNRSRTGSLVSSTPAVEKPAPIQRLTSRARSTRSASTIAGPDESVQASPLSVIKREPEEQRSSRQSTRARASPREDDQGSHEARVSSVQPDPAPVPESVPAPALAPEPRHDSSAFESLLATLSTILEPNPISQRPITRTGVLTKLYMDYKFPSYKNGQSGCHKIPIEEVIHYNAKELLHRLDQSKYDNPSIFEWLEELSQTAFNPVAIPLSKFPYHVVPREKKSVAPKPHQAAGDSGPTFDGVDDFMPPYDQLQSPRPGAGAGKGMKVPGVRPKSSLRPMKSSKKRPHEDIESESDSSESGAKKSHFFQDGDDSMEDAGDAISNPGPDHVVEIVIRADKIPSTVPQGLHGTWTCDQEDCNYVVRGGDEEACQARIKQHFEEHERQLERVQLAMTEGNRGHVQINNLLEKIKKLGEQSQEFQTTLADGTVRPQPIQTNLIV